MVFGIIPECRSASLRKKRSASPESPPISWKGTLQQYVGRLHRLHDGKKVVQVYDYVDGCVPMLARMYERRLKGYAAIGYVIEQETFPPHPPAAHL